MRLTLILATLSIGLTAGAAQAGNKKVGNCPPGLAKKNVPCVPPGQVKKFARGDYIKGDFRKIDSPNNWGLKRNGHYVRAGDYVYEIDSDTHKVLNVIGAVADVLK